jgi:hypothetical protein
MSRGASICTHSHVRYGILSNRHIGSCPEIESLFMAPDNAASTTVQMVTTPLSALRSPLPLPPHCHAVVCPPYDPASQRQNISSDRAASQSE